MNKQVFETESLVVSDVDTLKQEMNISDTPQTQISTEVESKLMTQADSVVDKLINLNPKDFESTQTGKAAVESMGLEMQKQSAKRSDMLKEPIAKLSKRGEDGGEVANALVDLKVQVEDLDPAQFDFSPGWFSRALGFLPFIGKPIKKYFSRYESAQTVLSAITNSLQKGQKQLERDNITLKDDQKVMRDLTHKLEQAIELGQLIDQKLEARLEREIDPGDPKHKFLQEEILFPLRQRIQDLQQQLVVNQQGFLAIEMIIRNNKELIRGVNRAINVTMSALQVAVTLALALANQRIVLEKVQAVNKTTDSLIAGTAQRLKEQGTEIHKMAAGTQLDMETLKQSFADIRSALDDISRFRQQALPKMARSIVELDNMTTEQEKLIRDLEEGNKVRESFKIEIA